MSIQEGIQTRVDRDGIGEVVLDKNAPWMAQTQRSLENFPFGEGERQPWSIIEALSIVKEACANVNLSNGKMEASIAKVIAESAREVRTQQRKDCFPLVIFQTGSGTQSNMNMNEVLANASNVKLGGKLGDTKPVHPNDHVNKGQSSNDVFPSALAIAITIDVHRRLLPSLRTFLEILKVKQYEVASIVKMGRTHLMDAVPMTLGQEFSAWHASLQITMDAISNSMDSVSVLALGGTAVGTGLNSYKGFDEAVAQEVSNIVGLPLKASPNKFLSLSQITPLVVLAGALSSLATALVKMANDIRLLSSGPRAGLGELVLPANEPGSSIMPGKVNPTQCESMSMVGLQVLGNMHCVTMANTYGHLQLNVFLPLVGSNIIRSIHLMSCSMDTFGAKCLVGIEPNHKQIQNHVQNSLMLVTALNPHIGYDNACKIAKNAHTKEINLKDSAIELGILTGEQFTNWVQPEKMAKPF